MNRFALPQFTPVTVEHVNLRPENHGDEQVSAIDLKLSTILSNTVLNLFRPGLRQWLYFKSSTPRPIAEDAQRALELDEPNDLPDLRFPELNIIKWHADQEGRILTLDYGLGGKSNVKLTDCRANEWRLECMQGGSVKVTFRVQRVQPDKRAVGELSGMLKHEVQAMLVGSPETESLLESQPDDEDESMAWPFATSVGAANGKPLDATDAFVAQHGTAAP
jgi:hypothetical protein